MTERMNLQTHINIKSLHTDISTHTYTHSLKKQPEHLALIFSQFIADWHDFGETFRLKTQAVATTKKNFRKKNKKKGGGSEILAPRISGLSQSMTRNKST